MTVSNENQKTLEEQFADECKVISLKYEYQGYIGDEKWAIISDLTEEEILVKYRPFLSDYIPFIVLPCSFGEVRDDFRRNEKKHHMRAARSVDAYNYEDGQAELYHPELLSDDFEQQFFKRENTQALYSAIDRLNPVQKERLVKYYFAGQSTRKIAKDEGVSHQAVSDSLSTALEKLKKFLI